MIMCSTRPLPALCAAVDQSRYVDIVAWNGAVPQVFNQLRNLPLGTLVAVTNYRVKAYNGQYEVALNADKPHGRVLLLTERT
jgi:hypothetical protein